MDETEETAVGEAEERSPDGGGGSVPEGGGIPAGTYEALAREISSEDSPVGIDAKHTHILILHRLERIERRLDGIERRLGAAEEEGG